MTTNAELRALYEAASPGPWVSRREGRVVRIRQEGWEDSIAESVYDDDADLIAAMRNKLLALLDDSERLADARDALYVLNGIVEKQRTEEKALQVQLAKLLEWALAAAHHPGCSGGVVLPVSGPLPCTCGRDELLAEGER